MYCVLRGSYQLQLGTIVCCIGRDSVFQLCSFGCFVKKSCRGV